MNGSGVYRPGVVDVGLSNEIFTGLYGVWNSRCTDVGGQSLNRLKLWSISVGWCHCSRDGGTWENGGSR